MQAESSRKIEQAEPVVMQLSAVEPAVSYGGVSIALHWLTAGLVVILWTLGQTIAFFPKGAPKIDARSVHIALGATLGIVLIVAGLHAAAALAHHYLLRDRVLRRMLP